MDTITNGTITLTQAVDIYQGTKSERETSIQTKIDMVRVACQCVNALAGAVARISEDKPMGRIAFLPKPWHNLDSEQQLAILHTEFPGGNHDLWLIENDSANGITVLSEYDNTTNTIHNRKTELDPWRETGSPYIIDPLDSDFYIRPYCENQQYATNDSDHDYTFKQFCKEIGHRTPLALVSYEEISDNPKYIFNADMQSLLSVTSYGARRSGKAAISDVLSKIMDVVYMAQQRYERVNEMINECNAQNEPIGPDLDRLQVMYQDVLPHWYPDEDSLYLVVNGQPYEIDHPCGMH